MTKKKQKRELVIREFEDGDFEAEFPTCKLEIKKADMRKFLDHWENGDIKEESPLNLGTPKLLKDSL